MWKFTIILILVLASITNGFCQEKSITKKNIVFAELGGAITAGVGLGYERYLNMQPTKRFSLRTGFGRVNSFSSYTSFLGSSFIYGKRSGLEFGLNYLMNYDASTFRSIDSNESNLQNDIQILVGYRYQNWENGLNFRFFYVPPVGCCGSFIPLYGGMSFGFAF